MKKILAVLLVLVMMMATVPGALAAGYNQGNLTGGTQVKANVAVAYTFTIPATITLNLTKGIGEVSAPLGATFDATNYTIHKNAKIKVSLTDIQPLESLEDETIPFDFMYGSHKIAANESIEIPFADISSKIGQFTVKAAKENVLYAGEYTGTLTFGFSYIRPVVPAA